MRPLLLAEAPARDDNWREPLNGRAGQNLMRHLGVEPTYENLRERFDVLNASERLEDAYPWSAPAARLRWTVWRLHEPTERLVVVCLGRRAAAAVGLRPDHPWGEWTEVGDDLVTALPHPSGRCRVYNDPNFRAVARAVLEEALDA